MADAPKLLYIEVVDDAGEKGGGVRANGGVEVASYRYTRLVLQSTVQLMGCKARHAFKISRSVFEVLRVEYLADWLYPEQYRKQLSHLYSEIGDTI